MNTVTTLTSKTKSGKTILVAIIPQDLAPGLECQHVASQIASTNGCTHYRVVDTSGAIVAAGKANSDARYGSFGPQG